MAALEVQATSNTRCKMWGFSFAFQITQIYERDGKVFLVLSVMPIPRVVELARACSMASDLKDTNVELERFSLKVRYTVNEVPSLEL